MKPGGSEEFPCPECGVPYIWDKYSSAKDTVLICSHVRPGKPYRRDGSDLCPGGLIEIKVELHQERLV